MLVTISIWPRLRLAGQQTFNNPYLFERRRFIRCLAITLATKDLSVFVALRRKQRKDRDLVGVCVFFGFSGRFWPDYRDSSEIRDKFAPNSHLK
jgi:hypothetical protein